MDPHIGAIVVKLVTSFLFLKYYCTFGFDCRGGHKEWHVFYYINALENFLLPQSMA